MTDMFYNTAASINRPDFFDESMVHKAKPSVDATRAGIDTTSIDSYRQGVELTQLRHYDSGIIKIHAGERGHIVRMTTFGSSRFITPDRRTNWFSDLGKFDSFHFIDAQEFVSYLDADVFSFPIVVDDRERWVDGVHDGVIEPLSIRPVAGLYSIDVPFISHDFKGEVMRGTVGSTRGACDIDQSIDVSETSRQIPYLDLVSKYEEYFTWWPKPKVEPYDDSVKLPNVESYVNSDKSDVDIDIQFALAQMTGSRDSYMTRNKKSTTSGWDYDIGLSSGTDSIAFGGMTY